MTSVAVIGTSGSLGKFVLDAFTSPLVGTFKYPILAVTTKDKQSTDKIEYIKSDFTDKAVVEKLAGVDIIVNLVNATATDAVGEVVKAVKPKVYIPSEYGFEVKACQKVLPYFGVEKDAHIEGVAKVGGIKVVRVANGYFKIPPYLYDIYNHVGIDPANNTVTYYSKPEEAVFVYSYGFDIARAIVAIAATERSKLLDEYRIQSGVSSVDEIAREYEEKYNVKLTPVYKDKEEERKKAQQKYEQGFQIQDLLHYINIIMAQGVDNGASYSKNENDVLNPGEKYWKWGKN